MINKIKDIEILAPAGSVSRMKAAFAGGADACYIGGRLFGARAYAENPDEEELIEAIYYAHLHKKKLYLTINTLLKEDELKDRLYDYVLPYYKAGIDAVLIQDLGVMKLLNEAFPDMELHASTQMSVCDTGAISFLKEFNVKRLVLARELTLKEIEAFKKEDIEIECFVHGALCVCYSGQCLMSSFNGGRSGNRGSCAGPCRMDYNLYSADIKDNAVPGKMIGNNPYLLSPKDICTIDYIPEMAEAGVNSFKIEGRMKRTEYAALTSYIYKKWLNIYLEKGKEYYKSAEGTAKRNKDIADLSDLYNRGSFTSGYLYMHNSPDMMADKRPNHNGVYSGRVKNVGGKSKKNVMLIEVLRDLNAHDVLEIRDEANMAKPVYEFTLKDTVKKGQSFEANFTYGLNVKAGMSVYRTKNEKLLTEINENIILKPLKRKICAEFKGEAGEELSLILHADNISFTVKGGRADKAANKPVTAERVKEALAKLGDTGFSLNKEDITVEMRDGIFFPMSVLNELRRNACAGLYEKIVGEHKRNLMKKPSFKSFKSALPVSNKEFKPRYIITASNSTQIEYIVSGIVRGKDIASVIINLDIFERSALKKSVKLLNEAGFYIYLRLPGIFRNDIKEIYRGYFNSKEGKNLSEIIKGFVIRNIEELAFVNELIKNNGITFDIVADANLYTWNSMAVETLSVMGIKHYTASLEQSFDEVLSVRNNAPGNSKLSMVIYGRKELMVTAQCQWKNKGSCVKELKNGKKPLSDILYIENKRYKNADKFPVAKNCEGCNNYIYADKPLDYFKDMETIKKINPDYLRIDFTFENEAEIREILSSWDFS